MSKIQLSSADETWLDLVFMNFLWIIFLPKKMIPNATSRGPTKRRNQHQEPQQSGQVPNGYSNVNAVAQDNLSLQH
jgi:hypothetical protein